MFVDKKTLEFVLLNWLILWLFCVVNRPKPFWDFDTMLSQWHQAISMYTPNFTKAIVVYTWTCAFKYYHLVYPNMHLIKSLWNFRRNWSSGLKVKWKKNKNPCCTKLCAFFRCHVFLDFFFNSASYWTPHQMKAQQSL